MSRRLNRFPYRIQTLKPPLRRGFIANTTPNSFLEIQPGLVARQVLHMQPTMGLTKHFHRFTPMPSGPIHIQPDRIPFEPPIELAQAAHEPFSVPLRPPHKPGTTKKRRYPSENVQPLAMLARRRYFEPFSLSCPPHPDTGMEGETRFILKHDRFSGAQGLQFFLAPDENALHPLFEPEDTNNWPVSTDTPVDASTPGPGAPSGLSHTAVSDAQRGLGHPSVPGSDRTPSETFPSVLVILDISSGSDERDDQASWEVPTPSTRVCLPDVSRRSMSGATSPERHKSNLDAGLLVSAVGLRPSFRYMLSDPGG
jgi:hypothetical protein